MRDTGNKTHSEPAGSARIGAFGVFGSEMRPIKQILLKHEVDGQCLLFAIYYCPEASLICQKSTYIYPPGLVLPRMTNKSQYVPSFQIRPPETAGDKGEPSKSILKDTERIFALIEDERHLVAHRLYENVKRRIQQIEGQDPVRKKSRGKVKAFLRKESSALNKEQEDLLLAKALLKENTLKLQKLEVSLGMHGVAEEVFFSQKDLAYVVVECQQNLLQRVKKSKYR